MGRKLPLQDKGAVLFAKYAEEVRFRIGKLQFQCKGHTVGLDLSARRVVPVRELLSAYELCYERLRSPVMAVQRSVYLECPIDRAFAAFTSPSAICMWWGDDKSYRTREWQSELTPGGCWHARFETAGGDSFGASGEYLVVEEPKLVEWTWRADWEDVPKRLRMEFEQSGAGTQLRAASEANYEGEMQAEDERGLAEILGWFQQHCRSV